MHPVESIDAIVEKIAVIPPRVFVLHIHIDMEGLNTFRAGNFTLVFNSIC